MKVLKILALTFSVALYTATILAQETKLIPLTTNSEKALELMRTVWLMLKNSEVMITRLYWKKY